MTNAASPLETQRPAESGPATDEAGFDISSDGGVTRLSLYGPWVSRMAGKLDGSLGRFAASQSGPVIIDLSNVRRLDTAGAWLIERFERDIAARGVKAAKTGVSPVQQVLLKAIDKAASEADLTGRPKGKPFDPMALFVGLGKLGFAFVRDFKMSMHILGATVRGAQMKLGHGQVLSFAAIVNQIDRMGVGAIPVILLMSGIIGAIIAQQGAFQLRYFGAEIFVVDLVGILVLREIGVLLTAIMVAGRSGSAITAEIGSMKMREEVDALTVIGLNPVGVLVFPRLVALVVALPLLTVISNFAALGGAMFVAWTYSDITPDAFIARMRQSIDMTTIFAGLIKAPFMALIIGIIASVEGMKVGGSAESLGRRVTASVVKAIFVVIVVDGFFAMFYAAIDF
jgi:phospholipid/cholesterol/gamma-HCH transport system permease protein